MISSSEKATKICVFFSFIVQLHSNDNRSCMISIEDIINKAKIYKPDIDAERIMSAYNYVVEEFKGTYRLSGNEYIVHLLAVADILLSFRPDEDAIIATFLHNIFSRPSYNHDEIKNRFGDTVAELVSALKMLDKVRTLDANTDIESLRKMFLAMAKDLRVVFIKLSDRFHNMMTLDYLPKEKHKLIAKETLDIYVPISARFGIYSMKGKLEDLCFKYLYPKQYEDLKSDLDEYVLNMGTTIEDIKKELAKFLKENGIEAEVSGRIKNLFSIYRKLKTKNRTMTTDLYDVFAIRAILPTKLNKDGREINDHLYGVLGLIHGKWTPLSNRFKDYIAVPKPNGYKSLHTTIMGLSPFSAQPTEIQIRSRKMHEEAEFGVASHWFYKDGSGKKIDEESAELYKKWINELSGIQKSVVESSDLLEALQLDVFNDRIFVLTPTGEVKDLPNGSTPIDFAYAVHSDVGNRCKLAKVDDKVVPLDYQLHNGEVVEVITSNDAAPKPHWLSIVKSSNAKSRIRLYFRDQDQDKYFLTGKDIINSYLEKRKFPPIDDDLGLFRLYNGKKLSLNDRIELVRKIGNKSVQASTVLRKVLVQQAAAKPLRLKRKKTSILPETNDEKKGIIIAGEKGLPYRLAACCFPSRSDRIVGYVTRENEITIHDEGCKMLKNAVSERILEAGWGERKDMRSYQVSINIAAKDRVGLIRDLAEVVSNLHVNILNYTLNNKIEEDVLDITMILEIQNNEQLISVISKLEMVRNILAVTKAS